MPRTGKRGDRSSGCNRLPKPLTGTQDGVLGTEVGRGITVKYSGAGQPPWTNRYIGINNGAADVPSALGGCQRHSLRDWILCSQRKPAGPVLPGVTKCRMQMVNARG